MRGLSFSTREAILDSLRNGQSVDDVIERYGNPGFVSHVAEVMQHGFAKYPTKDARFIYACIKAVGSRSAAATCGVSASFAENVLRVGDDFMREDSVARNFDLGFFNKKKFMESLKSEDLIKELKSRGYKGKLTKKQETDL